MLPPVADPAQAVLAPAVGAGTGVLMGEGAPGVAIGAVVLPNGSPLPSRQVRAPPPPRDALPGLLEALALGVDRHCRRRAYACALQAARTAAEAGEGAGDDEGGGDDQHPPQGVGGQPDSAEQQGQHQKQNDESHSFLFSRSVGLYELFRFEPIGKPLWVPFAPRAARGLAQRVAGNERVLRHEEGGTVYIGVGTLILIIILILLLT